MEERAGFKRRIVGGNDGISRFKDRKEIDLCYITVLIVFWNHAPIYCYFLCRSVPILSL
jgi:hypothetical protein